MAGDRTGAFLPCYETGNDHADQLCGRVPLRAWGPDLVFVVLCSVAGCPSVRGVPTRYSPCCALSRAQFVICRAS